MFSARRHEPGPIGGSASCRRYSSPGSLRGERVGARLGSAKPSSVRPAAYALMYSERDAVGGQGTDDRARRGAHDALGVGGAPAGLGLERVQRPDEPGGADHAPCPQDKTHTHAAHRTPPTDCQAVRFRRTRVRKGPPEQEERRGGARRRERTPPASPERRLHDRARARPGTGETPRMLLVFDGGRRRADPARRGRRGPHGARGDLPRHAPARRAAARPPRARVGLGLRRPVDAHRASTALRLESPLQSCSRCRGTSYTVPFSAFAYGVAHVFGAPAQAAPLFDRAREDFWSTRLAGGQPEARSGWSGRRGSSTSTRRCARRCRSTSTEVDIELTLAAASPKRAPARLSGRRLGLELAHADPDHRRLHRPAVRREPRRACACSTRPTRGPTRPGCSRSPRR